MSRKERRRARGKQGGKVPSRKEGLHFTLWTGVYGAAGVLTAALGFVLLAQGSINLAPVLLLIGFLVFFPLALVK